jgi:hypothetical protein
MTKPHNWQPRTDGRIGFKCEDCFLIATKEHQESECEGGEDQKSQEETKAFYLSLLPLIREQARRCGYAIGVHGSLVRDFDLIAVPWVDNAMSHEHLAGNIAVAAGGKILPAYSMVPGDTENKNPGYKPHGRIVWTILLSEGADAKFIDLSVMPKLP